MASRRAVARSRGVATHRTGTVGALAVAVTAAVALLSSPAGALSLNLRMSGDAQTRVTAVDAASTVRPHWPAQPIPPAAPAPAGGIIVALALLGVVVAATPRPAPVAHPRLPVVRAPPRAIA